MRSLTDEELIIIYQKDKDGRGQMALDHLYSRYAAKMLNYFYFTLHSDIDIAKDFVQDLFIRIIDNHHKFDPDQQFKAWIFTMASNMCKNEFRSQKVVRKYKNHILSASEPVVREIETDSELRKAINKLSQEQRSMVVLRFKMKLTIKEMAEIYNCPEGTIKSRLFYTIQELSKFYKI